VTGQLPGLPGLPGPTGPFGRPLAGPLVVLGDALLDVDVTGSADRLTPDAPVPVVRVEHESARPGGAGLAALLARWLVRRTVATGAASGADPAATAPGAERGPEVVLVTPVARDEAGERLCTLLAEAGVRVVPLHHDGATPVKRRIRARDQSIVRLDEGGAAELAGIGAEAAGTLRSAAAVLVSDYGQGLTATPGLGDLLAELRVPVVWDPHPRGAVPVAGAHLVTPSHAEAVSLTPEVEAGGRGPLADVSARAAALHQRWQARAVAVTLGERGVLLHQGAGPPTVVPAPDAVSGRDPCGAGDCFAAAAALALAGGALTSEAVQAAVAAATRFVAAGGASALDVRPEMPSPAGPPIGPDAARELAERVQSSGGTVVATGGCFDLLHAGHVECLRAARALGECLVVLLNSDRSVRGLKGEDRPIVPEQDRARVLAALDSVDAVVIFDEDTPEQALRRLRPDVWAKGGDYTPEQLSESAVLEEWGGRTVLLPYVAGRSTTQLVEQAAQRVP